MNFCDFSHLNFFVCVVEIRSGRSVGRANIGGISNALNKESPRMGLKLLNNTHSPFLGWVFFLYF